ncbi:MAG: FliH/SctL family protein [Fibromonadales bacterium]|nr:FliH/SctL family protein [Fibromonadales bacterium]
MEEKDPSKVQLKTILKGNAAMAIRPAAMAGFKVADFQMNPSSRETAEDRLKNEVAALQGQIATLNGEIANLKQKSEQDGKAKYDKGVQDGRALGAADGEKKAMEKFNTELKNLQASTEKTLESLALEQKENFEKIENNAAEIAIAVAKKVFCEEAAQNPNIIAKAIKEAFTFLGQEEKLKVRLNPGDVASAEKTEAIWKPMLNSLKSIELVIDNSIEQGGCLLESENGSSIDMRLETVWGHIEETVKRIYS